MSTAAMDNRHRNGSCNEKKAAVKASMYHTYSNVIHSRQRGGSGSGKTHTYIGDLKNWLATQTLLWQPHTYIQVFQHYISMALRSFFMNEPQRFWHLPLLEVVSRVELASTAF